MFNDSYVLRLIVLAPIFYDALTIDTGLLLAQPTNVPENDDGVTLHSLLVDTETGVTVLR